jgi:hypothetical protein
MGSTPVTIAFSDQNFVANIAGKDGTCFCVIRMEDASLSDLTDLSLEIFGNVRVPEGSVFLYGSASFLSRVGTGAYATDWVSVVSQAEKKMEGNKGLSFDPNDSDLMSGNSCEGDRGNCCLVCNHL